MFCRLLDQACNYRVLFDVVYNPERLRFISREMVKCLGLPECSCLSEQAIALRRCVALNAVGNHFTRRASMFNIEIHLAPGKLLQTGCDKYWLSFNVDMRQIPTPNQTFVIKHFLSPSGIGFQPVDNTVQFLDNTVQLNVPAKKIAVCAKYCLAFFTKTQYLSLRHRLEAYATVQSVKQSPTPLSGNPMSCRQRASIMAVNGMPLSP